MIKVAVVGAGGMASMHIPAFNDVPGVKVVGIYSRTRAKAEALAAEHGIATVCDSVGDLYEKTKADIVIVTVTELSMRAVAVECFEFPWTVLLEKPAGYNLADAESIAAAAKARNSRVFVGLNRRLLSSTLAVKDAVDAVAGPRLIHVIDQQSQAVAKQIGHPEAVIEHWMYANSVHLIDYFSWLGRGDVVDVTPLSRWGAGASFVLAHLRFSSGDQGIYEGLWECPGPWAVSVATAAHRWELRPLEKATFQNAGERALTTVEAHSWDSAFKPGFRRQALEVVEAHRQQPNQATTIEDALVTMRLIQKIYGV